MKQISIFVNIIGETKGKSYKKVGSDYEYPTISVKALLVGEGGRMLEAIGTADWGDGVQRSDAVNEAQEEAIKKVLKLYEKIIG